MSNGDPINSGGKSNSKRMGRYDGSYTPTEQRKKDSLMRQFCRDEGPPPSQAYLNAPCWCECGRLKSVGDMCERCAWREIADEASSHVDAAMRSP